MRILIIFWVIVLVSCIGQPQPKKCIPPEIQSITHIADISDHSTEIIFNGVHYIKAEEYTGSTDFSTSFQSMVANATYMVVITYTFYNYGFISLSNIIPK